MEQVTNDIKKCENEHNLAEDYAKNLADAADALMTEAGNILSDKIWNF